MRLERHSGPANTPEARAEHSTGNVRDGLLADHSLEPISTHLRKALEENNSYEPPGYGRPYRTPMWEFVRRAKRQGQLGRLPAFEAANIVERVLHGWLGSVRSGNPWQTLFPESEDPKAEFVYTWPRVKWAASALEIAQEEASHLPLEPMESSSAQYSRFISIIGHLQHNVDGRILVPCAKFAQILGCSAMAISRYRSLAMEAGLLRIESKGIRVQHKADEFTFAVERFDWKTGKQITSENLNLCLTPTLGCYTEIQENQEIERKEESQEQQGHEEIQDIKRKTRVQLSDEKSKYVLAKEPYIPTIDELLRDLAKTSHLR